MKISLRNGETLRWSSVVGIPKCITFPEIECFNYRTKKGYKIEFELSLEGLELHNILLTEKQTLWDDIIDSK
uniref:Uncharacterized protein n=1 Tax=Thermodesulfobium narugense TaxID=184064 RepID=A0A7C5KCU9_9BACT